MKMENITYNNMEDFITSAMDLMQKSMWEPTKLIINALGSMSALVIFSHLFKGFQSLLLQPAKHGLVHTISSSNSYMDHIMV